VGGAVVPPWVVPSESRVRAVRRRAEAWLRSSGGEARYRGITAALYWVAGVSTKSPVAEVDEPPSPGQALVEILAAEQALVGSQGLGAPGPRRRRPRMRSAWPDSGAGSTSRLF